MLTFEKGLLTDGETVVKGFGVMPMACPAYKKDPSFSSRDVESRPIVGFEGEAVRVRIIIYLLFI